MDGESLSDFLEESEFNDASDIFSILEALESASDCNKPFEDLALAGGPKGGEESNESFEFQKSASYNSPLVSAFQESETEVEAAANSPKLKRQKLNAGATPSASHQSEEGQPRMCHIAVERNRRKQMNENLSVLRSLMPCFYVKRGDQASIIGGVVNYINELQQVLQSLEAKKQRKAYDILSPRPSPLPISPRKPPLSPRLGLPISPRTPLPGSPYRPMLHNLQTGYLNSPSLQSPRAELSPCNSSTSSINDSINELVASSKSDIAQVDVKFCGPNLLLKTVSQRIPGQVVKIISALEEMQLEILQVNINKDVDERMLNSFTIKIGIECQLSAEELAQQIHQTFCQS